MKMLGYFKVYFIKIVPVSQIVNVKCNQKILNNWKKLWICECGLYHGALTAIEDSLE